MAPQNPNHQKPRRTSIMSDAHAMDLAAQQQQLGGKKKGNGKGGGFKFSNSRPTKAKAVPKAAQSRQNNKASTCRSSSPTKGASSSSSNPTSRLAFSSFPQFYEENGLRIPLFDSRGLRKAKARAISTLVQHGSVKSLQDIVKAYAGDAKLQEFKDANATKAVMAKWVHMVEMRAIEGVDIDTEAAKNVGSSVQRPNSLPYNRKRKSVMFSEQTKKKSKLQHTFSKTPAHAQQEVQQAPTKHTQPRSTEPAAVEEKPSSMDSDELEHLIRAGVGDQEYHSVSAAPAAMTGHIGKAMFKHGGKSGLKGSGPKQASKGMELRMRKVEDKHLTNKHPAMEGLLLDPHSYTAPQKGTKILSFASERVVISAMPSRYGLAPHILETTISPADIRQAHHLESRAGDQKTSEIVAPFLKPGRHGWDYDSHCWSWGDDPDLATGEGHQVELADQNRLNVEGSLYESAFRKKYPGRLGNQWPCGCQMPWGDSDSEAE